MRRISAMTLILLMLSLPAWSQPAGEEGVRIFSDSLKIMDQTGVVLFEGNVRVQLGEAALSCDKLTIRTSDENPSQVLSGTAIGNVLMERGEEKVKAGEARFDLEKETVDLTGSPALTKGLTGRSQRCS